MGDKQLLQRSFLRILATSGTLQKGVSVHRHSQALDIKSELTQVKMFCFLEGEGKEGQSTEGQSLFSTIFRQARFAAAGVRRASSASRRVAKASAAAA